MTGSAVLDAFSRSRLLVIGGAGFVGSNLIQALLHAGPAEIRIVDNLLSAERSNIPESPSVRLIEGSIADDSALESLGDEFDYIFHLATYHGNQSSIHDPLADHDNNTLTTLKLFNHVCRFESLKKVVYSSAGCAVAEKTFGPVKPTTEDDPVSLHMDSPYSISKLVGELYANYFWRHDGLPVVKARFQNVYGPGEILGAGKWRGTPATVWRNVTPTFIYRALKGMPILVENEGKASRDFIYVEDVVRGLMLCAVAGESGGVYNLASGVETTILELAELIMDLSGSESTIESGPSRKWDRSGRRFGSIRKSARELGFNAQVDLREGLGRTIEWTSQNLPAIESCIRKHAAVMRRCGAPLDGRALRQ